LGAAFKKDIDDSRNSSAIKVMEILMSEGATVEYHDPYIPAVRLSERVHGEPSAMVEIRSVPLTVDELRRADAVLILVGHSRVDYGQVVRESQLVFDAVNVTKDGASRPANVVSL